MALAPGTRLGAFEIRALLGQGGMGIVYRAHDIQLKRDVAIKVLPEAVAQHPNVLTRFQREAELLATLNHPFPVVQTNFEERDGQFSPDGNWIAYQSNASGRVEIYVQPFRGGNREQVSTNGGAQVRWRRDGKELFYIALDGRLMAVAIELNSAAKTIVAGVPTALFNTRVGGAIQGALAHQYSVASDGQRFLMGTISEVRTPAITVILNWKPRPIARE
jgi:WD40-like Beta Propeller Repeat